VISRRGFLKGLLGGTLAGLASAAYGLWVEPVWRLRVQRWQLHPAGWTAGPLRIVMLADLHAGAPQMDEARVARIVAAAQALQGDLVLLMGDYRASHRFQTRPVPIEATAPLLAELRAPLGVWAINGNHDWWDDPAAQARGQGPVHTALVLEAAGIPVLVNRAVRLGQGAGAFWLAGLDSRLALLDGGGLPRRRDDLRGTLAQVTDAAPVLLLAHEPDIFPKVPDRVSLTLSGHTHGGQVSLFGWRPVVPSRYGARFAWGHIREEGRDLVVSGGLGCSGIPVRIGVPPELTVVELGQAVPGQAASTSASAASAAATSGTTRNSPSIEGSAKPSATICSSRPTSGCQ
jgi:predicted MPP superfamily phosphohydrolase